MAKRFRKVAVKYAEDVIAGRVIIGKEVVAACRRFLDDLGRHWQFCVLWLHRSYKY